MRSVAASLRAWLARPLPWPRSVAIAACAVAITALHCVAYSALRGADEDILSASSWAVVNVAPFLLAFELGKRLLASGAPRPHSVFGLAAIACGALTVSILLQRLLGASDPDLAFETVRRAPALLLLGSGWLTGIALPRMDGKAAGRRDIDAGILESEAFDWVRAAGNYVEIPVGGRRIMVRLTMQQAEARLAPRGFVRVHRSVLVRAAAVADYRPGKAQDEIRLRCGASFRIGEKFRAEAAARFLLPRVA